MVVLLTFVARGTPVRRIRAVPGAGAMQSGATSDAVAPHPVTSDAFCAVARDLCGVEFATGHRVRVFTEGDALFDALLDDIAAAESLVTWHVFWFKPGTLAERVARALGDCAARGVTVAMLLDYFGSRGTGDDYVRQLREAGVDVAMFRPPRWNTLYKAQQRMHVRAVVVDGRIGYTGGFGIDDRWLGDGRHAGQWRDTSVRIEGEAVSRLQSAFVANYAEATGSLLLGDHVFAGAESSGDHNAALLYSAPSFGSTSAERFFFLSITGARERFWLSTAYFIPNRHFRRLLCAAARRGVDVRILTPGENTDAPSTWYAARAHYGELLDAGVRLYEYRPTMMHAKTLVVDGAWGMVGTLNFDNRSMVLNDEVALACRDPALGAELERIFRADLEWADELTPAIVARRSTGAARAKEWLAARVDRVL